MNSDINELTKFVETLKQLEERAISQIKLGLAGPISKDYYCKKAQTDILRKEGQNAKYTASNGQVYEGIEAIAMSEIDEQQFLNFTGKNDYMTQASQHNGIFEETHDRIFDNLRSYAHKIGSECGIVLADNGRDMHIQQEMIISEILKQKLLSSEKHVK